MKIEKLKDVQNMQEPSRKIAKGVEGEGNTGSRGGKRFDTFGRTNCTEGDSDPTWT